VLRVHLLQPLQPDSQATPSTSVQSASLERIKCITQLNDALALAEQIELKHRITVGGLTKQIISKLHYSVNATMCVSFRARSSLT